MLRIDSSEVPRYYRVQIKAEDGHVIVNHVVTLLEADVQAFISRIASEASRAYFNSTVEVYPA